MNKTKIKLNALAAASLLALSASTVMAAESNTFSFGLWGDMPYAKNGDGPKNGEKMTRLIDSMNANDLAFTIFDGDTKDGSSECTDAVIGQESIDLFNSLQAPTVYVLGDNEWTDCHRINNGSYSSLERLDYLRKTMFVDNYSFGQTKMKLHRQGKPTEKYSENVSWFHKGVMFVGLNIPGSNNNKIDQGKCRSEKSNRTVQDCKADNIEYRQRNRHNLGFLHRAFKIAKNRDALGLLVAIQADPTFDLPETEDFNERTQTPNVDGYNNFIAALVDESKAFNGQVVLVHGDTHFFKVDKPLIDQSHLIENFTRVETFGSPNIHWIKATVDPSNPNVFSFEPMIVPGN